MAIVYSKFLCEYTVAANVNDRFKVQDAAAAWHTITITAGRYRDHLALGVEIVTQLDAATAAGTGQAWSFTIGLATAGVVRITSELIWDIDWNVGAYGDDLRDDLGYDGTEVVAALALDATSVHLGGFYPDMPVEDDSRPVKTGVDSWASDVRQQVGVTGLAATIGGDNRRHRRSVKFLLSQDDATAIEVWLRYSQNHSFAYYHDRDVAWDGADNEYDEYKITVGDSGDFGYSPERVDPTNDIWHRQQLGMILRVAPTP